MSKTANSPRFWACRFCGNVMFTVTRPTRCFNCRRGESEHQLNDDRLFQEVDR